MNDIRQWLEQHRLSKYVDAFAENDVSLEVLTHVTEQILEKLGVSLGQTRHNACSLPGRVVLHRAPAPMCNP
jgi:hypothetical protein